MFTESKYLLQIICRMPTTYTAVNFVGSHDWLIYLSGWKQPSFPILNIIKRLALLFENNSEFVTVNYLVMFHSAFLTEYDINMSVRAAIPVQNVIFHVIYSDCVFVIWQITYSVISIQIVVVSTACWSDHLLINFF